jgi:23S rRNA pseudouridine1911/1915/1917 synthase
VQFPVDSAGAGRRLDQWLHTQLPKYSRARIQEWIKAGRALVNHAPARASQTLRAGDTVDVEPADLPPLKATPEDIPLHVLYEDAAVIAIDKPAGMVVHAGAGIHSGTLVNALLHRFDALSQLGGDLRPGIVHRLDRFTSGVLLVAKNDAAHQDLAAQFSSREVEKIYLALVQGAVKNEAGRIERPISRDPVRRIRMTARLSEGRAAWSAYRVLRRYPKFTFLEVRIGTGRTHQIRVHLSSIGHPVVGDTLYGAQPQPALGGRFFLHAHRITFRSPATAEKVVVESPLPPDLVHFGDSLQDLETPAPSTHCPPAQPRRNRS